MNRTQLVEVIANNANLTKEEAGRFVSAIIKITKENLKRGNQISLVGFGSFLVTKRAQRIGRNPQTGRPITIKAKKIVKFKPSVKILDEDSGPR